MMNDNNINNNIVDTDNTDLENTDNANLNTDVESDTNNSTNVPGTTEHQKHDVVAYIAVIGMFIIFVILAWLYGRSFNSKIPSFPNLDNYKSADDNVPSSKPKFFNFGNNDDNNSFFSTSNEGPGDDGAPAGYTGEKNFTVNIKNSDNRDDTSENPERKKMRLNLLDYGFVAYNKEVLEEEMFYLLEGSDPEDVKVHIDYVNGNVVSMYLDFESDVMPIKAVAESEEAKTNNYMSEVYFDNEFYAGALEYVGCDDGVITFKSAYDYVDEYDIPVLENLAPRASKVNALSEALGNSRPYNSIIVNGVSGGCIYTAGIADGAAQDEVIFDADDYEKEYPTPNYLLNE